jgi:uncharacterized protein (TIGR03066 family)
MKIRTRKRKTTDERFQLKGQVTGSATPLRDTKSAETARRSMARSRPWLYVAIALAVVAGIGSWALFENIIWSRIPPELVGKWEVIGGEQDGATFDFYPNGAMVGNVKSPAGRRNVIHASIRVDGNKILSTTRHPDTGQPMTMVLVIKTMKPSELVVEDEEGKIMNMKRAE